MADSSREFHKPVRLPGETFDRLFTGSDPAEVSRIAHATAAALLARVRNDPQPEVIERLVAFADEHGLHDLAELWSRAPSHSLPGALWRLYLVQLMIHDDPHTSTLLYERGRLELRSVDPVVAGAPVPATPDELVAVIDTILRGAFTGDFAVALERAAAFCRVQASGATHVADDYEATEPARATAFTTRALRLSTTAAELTACAALWRRDALT